MARPTEYSPTIIPIVKACATFGATREEIANYIGVSGRCFYSWTLEHEELVRALKRGVDASDERIEERLYRKALDGDTTAMIFYLKNRRPDRWRDVQNINADVGHYILSNKPMTEDEWIAARTKTIESRANTSSNVVATELSPDNDSTAKPLE